MALDIQHQYPPQPPSEITCDHHDTEIRRRKQSNGVVVYVRQCLRCGSNRGAVAKSSYEVRMLADISEWDQALVDQWEVRRVEHFEERRREWQARIPGSTEWWKKYDAYLNSPEWHRKRAAVLERDNYVCQGCMQRRAEHVHHLTYAHVGNELLFELVSVCVSCHRRIHPEMD